MLTLSLSLPQGRNLSNISIHPILFLESPIVQISDCDQLLLVSNHTKCILCNTDTEEFKQIGNQPRDGKFGATFLTTNATDFIRSTKIFCARPGTRFWECNLEGNVLQTHKFKNALKGKRCSNVRTKSQSGDVDVVPNIDQLGTLQTVLKRFILGYTETSFFVFDPKVSAIVLWNNEFDHIETIRVIDDDSLVIFTRNNELFTCKIRNLDEIFFDLLSEQEFIGCGRFLLKHVDYFKERLTDDKFLLYLSILKNKLKQLGEDEGVLEDIGVAFDETIGEILRERDQKEIERSEKIVHGTQLENGVYLVENSYAAVVKKANSHGAVNGRFANTEEIIVDKNVDVVVRRMPLKNKKPISTPFIAPASVLLEQQKPLTEEEKTVRGLFLIYKSLRMSNFSMVERYASIFDRYDIVGIAQLLDQLTEMIVENEPGTNFETAQRYCFEMYFNYFNPELIWEFDDAAREFIINAFVAVNSSRSMPQCDKNVQRCEQCNFPLAIEMFVLKHKSVAETLVKYLWSRNERRRCFDIVKKVPIVLTIVLKLIINDQLNVDMDHEDRASLDRIVDFLFACADKGQLERCIQHNHWFRDHMFWDLFFQRLARLHTDNRINCVDCGNVSTINSHALGSSKSFYSFDYALNLCADQMDGMDALKFSQRYSAHISNDAVTKSFYLKCLLNT